MDIKKTGNSAMTFIFIIICFIIFSMITYGVAEAYLGGAPTGAEQTKQLQDLYDTEMELHTLSVINEQERHDAIICKIISPLVGAKLLGDADGSRMLEPEESHEMLAARRGADCEPRAVDFQ